MRNVCLVLGCFLGAYYTGSGGSDYFNSYPARVQPGDVILVHAGVYKDDRYRYGGGLGAVSSGTYFLTQGRRNPLGH